MKHTVTSIPAVCTFILGLGIFLSGISTAHARLAAVSNIPATVCQTSADGYFSEGAKFHANGMVENTSNQYLYLVCAFDRKQWYAEDGLYRFELYYEDNSANGSIWCEIRSVDNFGNFLDSLGLRSASGISRGTAEARGPTKGDRALASRFVGNCWLPPKQSGRSPSKIFGFLLNEHW